MSTIKVRIGNTWAVLDPADRSVRVGNGYKETFGFFGLGECIDPDDPDVMLEEEWQALDKAIAAECAAQQITLPSVPPEPP